MLDFSRLAFIAEKAMLSKAPSISKKMPKAWFPALRECSILLVSLWMAESVEKLRLKPCWLEVVMEARPKSASMYQTISFSMTFWRVDVRLMIL